MAYRRSTGSKLRRAQPGLKIFREDRTAYRSRNRNDDKIRIRCEPLCADHAGGNGAKARGLRLLGIRAAENSNQQAPVTAEIEQDGGAHERVGTETDPRQTARFAAAGIFASPGYVSAGQVEFSMWVQAGAGIVAAGERWQR